MPSEGLLKSPEHVLRRYSKHHENVPRTPQGCHTNDLRGPRWSFKVLTRSQDGNEEVFRAASTVPFRGCQGSRKRVLSGPGIVKVLGSQDALR